MSVSALETSSLRASATARQVRAMRLPTLPRDFYVRSRAGACGFIAFALALWLGPGALATWLARENAGPCWAFVPALGGLCFVAGEGLHLFSRQKGFWARLFLTRTRANRAFFANAWRLARGVPLEMDERGLPLPRATYECYRWAVAPHAYGVLDSHSTRSAR